MMKLLALCNFLETHSWGGGGRAGTSRAFYFLQFDQCKSENWSWNIFLP